MSNDNTTARILKLRKQLAETLAKIALLEAKEVPDIDNYFSRKDRSKRQYRCERRKSVVNLKNKAELISRKLREAETRLA